MDLSDVIARNAAFTPHKPAIRFQGRTLTYAAFAARIAAAACGLRTRLGVGRGDRVAILAANHPDYLVLLYACARLGAMLVPLNWRLAVAEQLFILGNADVKALVLEEAFAAVVAPLQAALPQARLVGIDWRPAGLSFDDLLDHAGDDVRDAAVDFSSPLLVVYTSGTTGRPKGAVLRQEALVWNAAMSQHMHGLTAADHVLTVLPLFHVGGLNIQTTPALQLGATVTLHARFAPDAALAALRDDMPTLVVLVPATIQAMIEHPHWPDADLASLRAVTTGSTVVPQPLIDVWTARAVPVLQVYGSTETCPIAIYTRMGGDLSRGNSTGLPGLFCEARIVDDAGRELPHGNAGEIVVRGRNLFTEYWRDAAASREALYDGWYHTGDIASRDGDGYFNVHERRNNIIISGGENIYPAEVERVLGEHPGVAEAAVIGRPDPRWQEVPVAYVVRRAGAPVTAADLTRHVGEQLARFKIPRDFIFVDDLPHNALGKVQHFRLRQMARDAAPT
ncbi:MAG: AMP-binding protein [Alphaproteobacteria bacterium]|nr:AMP-binding protein [Alphaproteobacteria bacterium]